MSRLAVSRAAGRLGAWVDGQTKLVYQCCTIRTEAMPSPSSITWSRAFLTDTATRYTRGRPLSAALMIKQGSLSNSHRS